MTLLPQEVCLKGVPICRGVAVGKPFFLSLVEDNIPEYSVEEDNLGEEINRYRKAVECSIRDVTHLQKQLQLELMVESATILDAHLQLLKDPLMTTHIEMEILNSKMNAEAALQNQIRQHQIKFNSFENPIFKERFKDLQDITKRIMDHLKKAIRVSLADLPFNSIVFSRELAVSDTAEANISLVSAFVTELGSATSHAAIVAKAKGAPYVSSVNIGDIDTTQHSLVIVDGRTGDIILSPSEESLSKYERVSGRLESHTKKLEKINQLKAETFDGYPVNLSANVAMASELAILHEYGGHGVGLFRSEYIFLAKESFPPEEEQYKIYKDLVDKMKGLPIVIRVFDIGGDKPLVNQQSAYEANPSLGCRAIRFLLREREIFNNQIRAILRASYYGKVSIMFPMVSTLSELVEAKKMVFEAQAQLEKQGIPCGKKINIGCMIEVPSAAMIADLLASECDFLSIGTNDLVQYALAVDRANESMNSLYTPSHPSVLRLIKMIINEANRFEVPVTVCGEVASDPRFTALLLGLGVSELSVATRYIPTIKHAIRSTSIVTACRLAESALALRTASEVQEFLAREYKKNVPDDCFYNCDYD